MPEEILNEEVVETAAENVAKFGFMEKAGLISLGVGIAVAAGTAIAKFVLPRAKKAFQKNVEEQTNENYVAAEPID